MSHLRTRRAVLMGLTLILVVTGAWLFDAVTKARRDAINARRRGQVTHLRFVLENYVRKYGRLPPIRVMDKESDGVVSWRLALARYLFVEERSPASMKDYDFARPWDDPGNLAAAARNDWFQADRILTSKRGVTQVLGIDYPLAPWGRHREEIRENLPLLVVVPGVDVQHFEPRDVTIDQLDELAGRNADEPFPAFVVPLRGPCERLTPDMVRRIRAYDREADSGPFPRSSAAAGRRGPDRAGP